MTPLMWASIGGQLDIVNLFLARGAVVNARMPNGYTALRFAQMQHHPLVVQRLREAGATE
jgi:ankyrin repeat protein